MRGAAEMAQYKGQTSSGDFVLLHRTHFFISSCELSLVLRRVVGRRSWCLLLSRGLVISWRLHLTYTD